MISAVSWGAGDFGGGLASRRAPVFGVVLISQVVGMSIALAVAIWRGESLSQGADVGWSVAAGIAGGIGIASLYRALSIGRMAVVAPVTAILAACLPVAASFAIHGLPDETVMVGIGLALVAVLLVSRSQGEGEGRSRGLGLAVLAGAGFGLFGVCIGQLSEGAVFAPLVIVRGTEAVMIGGLVLVTRAAWRPPRKVVLLICVVGLLDMSGNGAYILSAQAGSLAVAAVLSSLYPVTTVVLAAVVLRERVSRSHAVGIGLAAVAVVLIAAGSA